MCNDVIELADVLLEGIDSARASIEELRPQLEAAVTHEDSLHKVRDLVTRYLPEMLANYLALPPLCRSFHVLKGGKTARRRLLEMLSLLDKQMKEVVANVEEGDTEAARAHGQLLHDRFRRGRNFIRPQHE